jgi:hypothetical protein
MENSSRETLVRRSKRTTPIYRDRGGRKFLPPNRQNPKIKLFPMIRGISWNIRGMNKKGMRPYVRRMMVENKFDFICIQETILKDFSDKCLRKFDPNREYL